MEPAAGIATGRCASGPGQRVIHELRAPTWIGAPMQLSIGVCGFHWCPVTLASAALC
jgi:hypothetical protein